MPTRAAAKHPEGIAALIDGHIQDLQVRRWSISAQDQARHVLPALCLHLREEGVLDPCRVAVEHLVRFAHKLGTQGLDGRTALAPRSQAAYLGAVKRFFAFLMKRRLILLDPAREIRPPKSDRLPRMVLSEAQARRLMAAPFPGSPLGRRDRAILETLYGTAVRGGECRRLDLGDLDLGQGILLVRDGKGRKDRLVPVTGRALLALDLYLREARRELVKNPRQDALFLTRFGTRLGKAALAVIVRRHAQAARITRPVSPHVLRHTPAPRTSSKAAPTSATSRSCSATKASRARSSTPGSMSRTSAQCSPAGADLDEKEGAVE